MFRGQSHELRSGTGGRARGEGLRDEGTWTGTGHAMRLSPVGESGQPLHYSPAGDPNLTVCASFE